MGMQTGSWRRRVAAVSMVVAAAVPAAGVGAAWADPASSPELAAAWKAQLSVLTATGVVPAARSAAVAAHAADASENDAVGLGLGVGGVAVGARHTCAPALLAEVWCWGANDEGQLGVGTTTDSPRPVRASAVGGLRGGIPVSLAAGRAHTCALILGNRDSTVYCWGANNEGQIGDGSTTDRTRAVDVATGAFGVAVGEEHTCVITETQTVSCWGRNDVGQLGIGTTGGNETEPQTVPGLTDIVDIAADDNDTCAVDEDGDAWCWGSDTHGQLGDGGGSSGTPQASPVPVTMTGVPGGFVQIDVGARHVCALAESLAVYCWGSDSAGQLGNGASAADPSRPSLVAAGGRRFLSVHAGGDSTCATSSAGTGYCWGANGSGQLGTGDADDHAVPAPVDQSGIRRSPIVQYLLGIDTPMVADVNVGDTHGCAVDLNLTVYCWGANAAGELGDGTTDDASVPTITLLAPGPATAVHATARDRALAVRWSAPADTGVAPISAYAAIAIHGTGPEAVATSADCGTTGKRACTIAGLVNDRRYDVFVGALTLGGVSYTGTVTATPKGGGSGGGLPVTGPGVAVPLAIAAMLLGAGVFCLLLARRRTAA